VESRYRGRAQIPDRRIEEPPDLGESCWPGCTFSANSTEHLSYLTKLGFFEKEICFSTVEGYEGYLWLFKSLFSHDPVVYDFVCIEEVPDHLVL